MDYEKRISQLLEERADLLRHIEELERTISFLEEEISRLEDEASWDRFINYVEQQENDEEDWGN